jgi:hypothetical protein
MGYINRIRERRQTSSLRGSSLKSLTHTANRFISNDGWQLIRRGDITAFVILVEGYSRRLQKQIAKERAQRITKKPSVEDKINYLIARVTEESQKLKNVLSEIQRQLPESEQVSQDLTRELESVRDPLKIKRDSHFDHTCNIWSERILQGATQEFYGLRQEVSEFTSAQQVLKQQLRKLRVDLKRADEDQVMVTWRMRGTIDEWMEHPIRQRLLEIIEFAEACVKTAEIKKKKIDDWTQSAKTMLQGMQQQDLELAEKVKVLEEISLQATREIQAVGLVVKVARQAVEEIDGKVVEKATEKQKKAEFKARTIASQLISAEKALREQSLFPDESGDYQKTDSSTLIGRIIAFIFSIPKLLLLLFVAKKESPPLIYKQRRDARGDSFYDANQKAKQIDFSLWSALPFSEERVENGHVRPEQNEICRTSNFSV